MPTLLLVDGSSYLYRAFHALPDLRNAQGEPTGALRGVINMLRRLAADYKAEYRAVVFDAKGKTFREDWYPDYKGHRPPMPEDLAAQIAPIHEAVRALGWPLLMVEGVEADDVIGTLAAHATERGIDCVISTGDKDLAQLVNRHVTLVNTMSEEKLDEAGVLAKFGVPPSAIVDYLALIGDSVDNVPGVDKCGPKTAVKWLQQYGGTLDAVIAHAADIGGKVGENLRAHLDFLPMARRLLTVKCDVELPQPLESLTSDGENAEALRPIYERYGFRGLLDDLAKGGRKTVNAPAPADDVAPSTAPEGSHRADYETLLDRAAFERWLAKLMAAEVVSLDTETTGLDPMEARLVGMSFALAEGEAAYLPLGHVYPDAPAQLPLDEVLAALRPWLESPTHGKLGQNLKYDRHVFANHGIRLAGVVDDTLLESYVLEADRNHNLDTLVTRHLGLKVISYDEVTGKGAARIGFEQVPLERAAAYAAEDADVTLRVHRVLAPRIAADRKLAYIYRDIELPVSDILFEMERNGVLLDVGSLAAQSNELGQKMLDLERRAHEAAKQPFNINSPKQLAEILFEREKLPVIKKTPSGTPSTDEEVLSQLALDYPLPALILEYRSLAKLKGTYTDKLPRMVRADTGRVHTSFGQAVAVTGRLSSVDPNLQNIPVRTAEGRRIRSAFIAPPGHVLVSADYSQIELRIMAHLSQDARLLQAFADGEDIHRATAAEVFGVAPAEVSSEQRRYAKVINFGLIYGMSAHGLAKNLDIERSAAQSWIDRYFAQYPGVARYMDETRALAREQGYVETVFGRRLQLPDIRAQQVGRRQGAERAAINAPMQGTAADLIKLAMIAVSGWLKAEKLATRLILQVHDELVLEVPDAELDLVRERVPALMEGVAQLSVPLKVEAGVGRNWDEAH
ncbi:DNA polymerase I [Methyloversatilis universalis FAM5]|uniref:DNA polymerase I n=2 Tax=Pseudomonadota TaxID=1224 RepID=F5RFB7_METUF|nr:DNA polymerase I [Methyloversatilis universalis]EGK70773.1 DNA polymerase I [Methyloversatilis universalis FAM5]